MNAASLLYWPQRLTWLLQRVRQDPRRIAVAIPTYNRSAMVLRLVRKLEGEARIAEIVVRDDHSSAEEFAVLEQGLAGRGPRIRLARNDRNLGVHRNKMDVLGDTRLDWALLLDSDNEIGAALLDPFFALTVWSPQVIYCPERAQPNFDFSSWSGAPLDLAAVGELLRGPHGRLLHTFLNSGNSFVHVSTYRERLRPYFDAPILGADAILSTVVWLYEGGQLFVVPGARYRHRVHDGSFFKSVAGESKPVVRSLAASVASGSRATVGEILALHRMPAAPAKEGAS